jgi:hypothetical protein
MAKGFGQYVPSKTSNRIEPIRSKIDKLTDPEDMMIEILTVLTEKSWIPEVGKFYTFIYNPKTPDIEYDQHPLIACTEIQKWGFKGLNFHWRKTRNYTWEELAGQMHLVRQNELDDLLSIPYEKFRLNK